MNTKELLRQRRTIQNFNAGEVSRNLLLEALDLGLWAPNHKMTLPWRYTLVGMRARKQLAGLKAELMAAKSNEVLTEQQINIIEKPYLTPAHLVALGMARSGDPRQEREDFASVAMAVQNISLYLWDQQVGAKWSSGGDTNHPKAYEILGIDPKVEELVGFLWVGRFDRPPRTPQRPSLTSVLREVP